MGRCYNSQVLLTSFQIQVVFTNLQISQLSCINFFLLRQSLEPAQIFSKKINVNFLFPTFRYNRSAIHCSFSACGDNPMHYHKLLNMVFLLASQAERKRLRKASFLRPTTTTTTTIKTSDRQYAHYRYKHCQVYCTYYQ